MTIPILIILAAAVVVGFAVYGVARLWQDLRSDTEPVPDDPSDVDDLLPPTCCYGEEKR